ncbi:MAG: maleylpyruvate isomerase family mycothiol-dependent enzyme [Acidimicrobiia bacterium]|nr:maleylpyruvate isomerase family mycothiol-dependent enzyme [Acidimicrobiia bacterium]
MKIRNHIDAIQQDGERLAAAASRAGLDAPIVWCPGWQMRELLRHLSEIHLWAASHVARTAVRAGVSELEDLEAAWPDLAVFWPEDADLIEYYLATNANLVSHLDSAPADLDTWTFLPAPSPVQMWARRQAHETAIHRFDAQSAIDSVVPFDSAFASDGIDEILTAMAPRYNELPLESAVTLAVHPTDAEERWTVTLGPDGIDTVRTAQHADLTLSGTASDLYLAVWNRGDDSAIEQVGDLAVLDIWRARHRSRWPRTRDEDEARAQGAAPVR